MLTIFNPAREYAKTNIAYNELSYLRNTKNIIIEAIIIIILRK